MEAIVPQPSTINHGLWLQTDCAEHPSFSLYCIAEAGSEIVGPCKVGIATHMQVRLSSLQGGNFRRLILVWQIRVAERDVAKEAEQLCLARFRPSCYAANSRPRLHSEWVETDPLSVLAVATEFLNIGRRIERAA
jgi:hypothetical protein